MSATVTTAHSRSLRRLWATLPDRELGERELDESIIKASGAHEGDYAWASAIRAALTLCGAVAARTGDAPREFIYRRSTTFPDVPTNNGPGSAGFNEQLRRDHEALERELREQDARAAQMLADSPLGYQRREIVALIDQKVDARLRPLEEMVARLSAQNGTAPKVAPITDEAGIAGRRSDNNE